MIVFALFLQFSFGQIDVSEIGAIDSAVISSETASLTAASVAETTILEGGTGRGPGVGSAGVVGAMLGPGGTSS